MVLLLLHPSVRLDSHVSLLKGTFLSNTDHEEGPPSEFPRVGCVYHRGCTSGPGVRVVSVPDVYIVEVKNLGKVGTFRTVTPVSSV